MMPDFLDNPLTSCSCMPPHETLRQALKPGTSTQLDAATLEAVAGEAPSATLKREQVAGCTVAEVMVTVGLQPSKGQARK